MAGNQSEDMQNVTTDKETFDVYIGPMVMVPLTVYGVVLGVSVTYLTVCLSNPKLRVNHGKWLQIVAVVASVVFNTCLALDFLVTYTSHSQVMRTVPVLCSFLVPLTWIGDHLFTICLVLVTLERLLSLWRGDHTKPGFSRRTASFLLCLVTVVLVMLIVSLVFGFGGVKIGEHMGLTYCVVPAHASLALSFLYLPSFIILLVLTGLMIIRLYKTRACDANPYPLHKTLPIIMGNLLLISGLVSLTFLKSWFRYILDVEPLVHVMLVLCWLVGERDVRLTYCRLCWPCCPQFARGDGIVELVNS